MFQKVNQDFEKNKESRILPLNMFGVQNIRIFDDQDGIMEELEPINILTGANNSGKSSFVKTLQMLKDSVESNEFPFNINLTQQKHLLGDLKNILHNKNNPNLVITLPFPFLGIETYSISVYFEASSKSLNYEAKIKKLEVIDKTDETAIFQFHYRDATENERKEHKKEYIKELKEFEQKMNEDELSRYSTYIRPWENPLLSVVEWEINQKKLKEELTALLNIYTDFLEAKKITRPQLIEEYDKVFEEERLKFSIFIDSLKNELDRDKWKIFLEKPSKEEAILKGKEPIEMFDTWAEDHFSPGYSNEEVFYDRMLEVLTKRVRWNDLDKNNREYSVIEHIFDSTIKMLLNRILKINYLSNEKGENTRIFNAAENSSFVNLLKKYQTIEKNEVTIFVNNYLELFAIGKEIRIDYNYKYQVIKFVITTLEGEKRELVDFGFGIKQLIFLLLNIAVLADENSYLRHVYNEYNAPENDLVYKSSILIVEEPETNLHPKWQSLLAEMFIEANEKFNIQLIIETHSEYLIRKLQTLVADNKARADSIKILYFRNPKDKPSGKNQVESIRIEQDGSINYNAFDSGFFDEQDNLKLSLLNIQRDMFISEFEDLKIKNIKDQEKIIELENKIDEYTQKQDLTVHKGQLDSLLGAKKANMDEKSYIYFLSAKWLFENIKGQANNYKRKVDFSPVVIQCGRVVELEMLKFFEAAKPNIQAVRGNSFSAPNWSGCRAIYTIKVGCNRAGNNVSFNKYKKNYLESTDKVNNNAMWDSLAVLAVDETTKSSSDYKFLYNELINNFHNVDTKILKKRFLSRVHKIIQSRNNAAHSSLTTKRVTKNEVEYVLEKTEDFILTWILNKK